MENAIVVMIDENGNVSKSLLLEIHSQITHLLQDSNDFFGMKYGFYITRVYNFLKLLEPRIMKNILDFFRQDIQIKINLSTLIDYISIAREYIPVILHQKQNISCPNCHTMLVTERTDGELICEDCGFIYDTRLPGIKDLESINTCKSYYSLKSNLLRAIQRFEGNQCTITKTDLDTVIGEINRRNINTSFLKGEQVVKILKDLKLEKYYDELYSLIALLTNKPRKSIQPFIPQILRLHDELEHAYTTVKNPLRINSLNVHFKLYKLLKLCDQNCDLSELCTLKTEQKFEEHEEKWRDICKLTGWT